MIDPKKYHIVPAEWLEKEIEIELEISSTSCVKQLRKIKSQFPSVEVPSDEEILDEIQNLIRLLLGDCSKYDAQRVGYSASIWLRDKLFKT